MKRPPKRKRNLQVEPPQPTKFSRKDLLNIWGIILLIFGVVGDSIAVRVSYEKAAFAKSLNSTIDGWRGTYHLTDAQARRILELEFAFHGTGNQFTKPPHAPNDRREHHRAMAAVMNPEDGNPFFYDQEGVDFTTSPN